MLLKDNQTCEEVKRKFAIEQDNHLYNRRLVLKRTYNPDKIESRIEDARYLINRYYRKNEILAIDVNSSKFISKNVLVNELNKMISRDLKPVDEGFMRMNDSYEYYDIKTINAIKKIIEELHVLEV
jgi:hypothetical protein